MDVSAIPTIEGLDVGGQRVLVRLDLDVPIEDGAVADDTRIRATLPTIEYLTARNARVVVMDHLGEPSGRVVPALSMEPVAVRLAELLTSGEVFLTDSPVGDGARRVSLDLRDGQVAVLENLRFHAGETRNDDKFSRGLAALGDIYVNDAFGVIHHRHASIAGLPRLMSKRAAGLLVRQEVTALDRLLTKVEHPFVAVFGGGFSENVPLIQSLMSRLDVLVLGGDIANTFLAARRHNVGRSTVERDKLAHARDLLRQISEAEARVVLPVDVVTQSPGDGTAEVLLEDIPAEGVIVDVGVKTRALYKDAVSRANTVLWKGPIGQLDQGSSREGSVALAKAIAGSAAFSVVIGDEARIAVRQSGMEKGFNHMSTGGEAALEMLEGRVLPGLQSLVAK